MNEIIKKIDELLEELPRCCNANYMKDGCVYKMKSLVKEVRQAIQAEQKKPKTNGERIREMNNEELANWIFEKIESTEWDEDGNNNYEDDIAEWLDEVVSKRN